MWSIAMQQQIYAFHIMCLVSAISNGLLHVVWVNFPQPLTRPIYVWARLLWRRANARFSHLHKQKGFSLHGNMATLTSSKVEWGAMKTFRKHLDSSRSTLPMNEWKQTFQCVKFSSRLFSFFAPRLMFSADSNHSLGENIIPSSPQTDIVAHQHHRMT